MNDVNKNNYLKKELYELIKTDESIFDFIQESSLDGLWYWDLEKPENEWMNPKFWTVLGYNPDEMPHKASAWQDIINENDLKTATENFNRHCENPNHPYDQIVRYTHKNGSTVWIRCRGLAIRNKDGKAVRMLGAHHDITTIKQAEISLKEKNEEIATQNEELRQANQQLSAAKENAEESETKYKKLFDDNLDSITIFRITPEGVPTKILEMNNNASVLVGYTKEEMQNMTANDFEVNPTIEKIQKRIEDMQSNGFTHFETIIRHKKGHEINVEVKALVINYENEPALMNILRDITERKKAEQALNESEERFRGLFENSPIAYQSLNENGCYIDSNQRLCNLLGYTHKELSGKYFGELFSPRTKDYFADKFKKFLCEGKVSTELELMHKSGSLLTLLLEGTIQLDNEGNFVRTHCILQDITERKKTEEDLRKSEDNFRQISENMTEVFWLRSADNSSMLYVNPAYEKVWGRTCQSLYENPQSFTDSVYDEDKPLVFYTIEEYLKASTFDLDYRIVRPDGQIRWVNAKSFPVLDDAGEVISHTGIARDITEEKRSKQELEIFKTVADNALYGKSISDMNGNIIYINKFFANIHGYTQEELIGQNISLFYNQKQMEDIERIIMHMEKNGYFEPTEVWHIDSSGTEFPMLMSGVTIKDQKGNPLYLATSAVDITVQKQAELLLQERNDEITVQNEELNQANLELIAAKEKLKEANATKDQFISILGHDLNNPFSVLLGFTDLLVKNIDKYDKEKIRTFAETINKTSKQTFNLLNNLLEWSRSQRDKIPFNPQTTNLYFLAYETYILLNNSAEPKQITIDLDIPEEIDAKVDSEMIKTVMRNLLSNAIKFTPENGTIHISASKEQACIQFVISDTGTGMSPETINSLFKIGKIVSRPGTYGERGTGFGLLLCKEFIDKHGGRIWVESEIGKGSKFIFTLPTNGGGEKV